MSVSPPSHEVLLTAGAEQDIAAIHEYVATFDSPAKADALLDQLIHAAESLAHFPERGNYPKELIALGIREYRQTSFGPYRVIYRIVENRVFIHLIVDGRRNMQALLARRLLGA